MSTAPLKKPPLHLIGCNMARKEHIKVIGNGNCPFLSPFCPQFGDRIGDKMGTNDFFDYLGTHLFQ